MNYKYITLAFVAIFLFITGCKQQSVPDETSYKFSFSEYNQVLPMESIFESVEATPLDSKNVPLIGKVGKVILQNDLFYIHDALNQTILTFDTKGNFIRILDKNGKGPGEYLKINDFELNKFDNTIDLMEQTGMVNQYTHDGQFVDRYFLPGEIKAVHHFVNLTKDIVVFYNCTTDDRLFYYSRSKNAIIRKEFNQPWSPILRNGSPLTRINDKISFYEGFSNQRYVIDTNGIYDDYKIDLDEYNLFYQDLITYGFEKIMNDFASKSLPKAFSFASIENDEYIVSSIRINDTKFHLLINKKNGSQTGLKAFTNGCLFPEDADELHGNELIKVIPAYLLDEYIKPKTKGGMSLPTVDNLSEYDNPVILKYKLKERF